MKSQNWTQIADWNRILFQHCVCEVKDFASGARNEEVLRWASLAGWFASRAGWFGELSSVELETALIQAAKSLPAPDKPAVPRTTPRWLHVLSEAYPTLGHTNLCRRWIEYDVDVTHDVILLDQKSAAPANLLAAVKKSGGEVVVLDNSLPMLDRALALREFAWQHSDVVVLHTHPEDVIATAAFGIPGGPPVLLVNHADHAFWFGCSIADIVLDIRTSGMAWTNNLRGVKRSLVLPLPLQATQEEFPGESGDSKGSVRKELGIPEDAILFFTVGSPAKYRPMRGLDFVETALKIIQQCPNGYLIAIGPHDKGQWKKARNLTQGRIQALGYRPNSMRFCRAADIYLEGFPIGSLTAFLEAAEAGLPGVRNPRQCVPPFASDSPGLEPFPQPQDSVDFVRTAVNLASDTKARMGLGHRMRQAVRSEHCGKDWLARLQSVKGQIPKTHSVHLDFIASQVEPSIRDWHIEFCWGDKGWTTSEAVALSLFTEAWKRTGSEPAVQTSLWAALNRLSPNRSRETISLGRLNRRIRARGQRSRLLANALQALAKGHAGVARRSVYSCLRSSLFCISDIEWIKLFVKVHFRRAASFRSKQ